MKQQREILRKEKETAEKIAARAFAQSYLADLVPSVFGTLSDNGYFYDPVERGVYTCHISSSKYISFFFKNFATVLGPQAVCSTVCVLVGINIYRPHT